MKLAEQISGGVRRSATPAGAWGRRTSTPHLGGLVHGRIRTTRSHHPTGGVVACRDTPRRDEQGSNHGSHRIGEPLRLCGRMFQPSGSGQFGGDGDSRPTLQSRAAQSTDRGGQGSAGLSKEAWCCLTYSVGLRQQLRLLTQSPAGTNADNVCRTTSIDGADRQVADTSVVSAEPRAWSQSDLWGRGRKDGRYQNRRR